MGIEDNEAKNVRTCKAQRGGASHARNGAQSGIKSATRKGNQGGEHLTIGTKVRNRLEEGEKGKRGRGT